MRPKIFEVRQKIFYLFEDSVTGPDVVHQHLPGAGLVRAAHPAARVRRSCAPPQLRTSSSCLLEVAPEVAPAAEHGLALGAVPTVVPQLQVYALYTS